MKYCDNFDWKRALRMESLYVCMIGKARVLLREISRKKGMKTEQREGEAKRGEKREEYRGRGKGRKKESKIA